MTEYNSGTVEKTQKAEFIERKLFFTMNPDSLTE